MDARAAWVEVEIRHVSISGQSLANQACMCCRHRYSHAVAWLESKLAIEKCRGDACAPVAHIAIPDMTVSTPRPAAHVQSVNLTTHEKLPP